MIARSGIDILPMPLTCSGCRHWHAGPLDPHNLAAPRKGECREQPHALPLMTPQGLGYMAVYLTPTADFPACGRYQGRGA